MKSFVFTSAVLVCGGLLAATIHAAAFPNKTPTIKEIMTKLNKDASSLTPAVGKALRAAEPDWSEIQQQTQQFAELAEALGKNGPPKGSKESWEKLTAGYLETAKALNKAAQDKDKRAALSAHAKLRTSCLACHRAHRGS
jgi:cytochrome c556